MNGTPEISNPRAMLSDFVRARSVLWLLVRRDLKGRYAGSTLGGIWNIIHPIFLVGIYILVFSSIMVSRSGGGSMLDYAVHLTAGMIPWLVFHDILSRTTGILVENANFLQKVSLPVEILHLSIVVNTLLIHFISNLALILFLLLVGHSVPIQVLLTFPLLILTAIVALGLGLILSVLNLVLRDTAQITVLVLQLLFWLTPIVYPLAVLPDLIQNLLRYNPLLPFISYSQLCFGDTTSAMYIAPHNHIIVEGMHLLAILPFIALASGIMFLRSHRDELLDAL